MKNIILTDLDGTLADLRHRRHFVDGTMKCPTCNGVGYMPEQYATGGFCAACKGKMHKKNWTAFHKACVDDTPIETTIELINGLSRMGIMGWDDFEVWIVSGRSDEVRKETEDWLSKANVLYNTLIMRKAGDYTPDDTLKESWLLDGTIPKERVFCVFDDRDRVVKMWRKHGLTCYQVAEGDF